MTRFLLALVVVAGLALPAAAEPFLSITFTDENGASATRTAGPDLATLNDPTLWGDRSRLMLNTLYEERHGEPAPNIGAAIQSLADRWYLWLRAEEKRIRTEAAVETTKDAEDQEIPDS